MSAILRRMTMFEMGKKANQALSSPAFFAMKKTQTEKFPATDPTVSCIA